MSSSLTGPSNLNDSSKDGSFKLESVRSQLTTEFAGSERCRVVRSASPLAGVHSENGRSRALSHWASYIHAKLNTMFNIISGTVISDEAWQTFYFIAFIASICATLILGLLIYFTVKLIIKVVYKNRVTSLSLPDSMAISFIIATLTCAFFYFITK